MPLQIATPQGQRDMTPEEESAFIASITPSFEDKRKALKVKINTARDAAIYTDITLPFPVDSRTIQFRNYADRQNLSDKVTGALALALGGSGSSEIRYVCADNSIATMTASQFITAGLAALAAKDAIFYEYKALKDSADSAETDEQLNAIEAQI
jgi:hypothetical protein